MKKSYEIPDRPKVTVLMPAYNGEKYLREAVDSILNQTFTEFEFLIIDDGSTDKTWQILQEYAGMDQRIVLVQNDNNLGLAKSLNKGLGMAKGEYIARMDADDISLPERLAFQVAFLDENPNIGLVGSSVQLISTDGFLGSVWRYPTIHSFILWSLFFHTPIAHSTVIFRSTVIKRVGGYDYTLIANQDRDLWQRLSSVTCFANLPDVYLLYREHNPNSVSQRHADIQLRNSAKAGQRMMAQFLKYEVPFEICYNFRICQFDTADSAIQAVRIVHSLYDTFIDKSLLSMSEKLVICRDAAQRIIRLSWPFRRNVKMWGTIIAHSFRLNPLLALLTAQIFLSKVLHKAWHVITYQ